MTRKNNQLPIVGVPRLNLHRHVGDRGEEVLLPMSRLSQCHWPDLAGDGPVTAEQIEVRLRESGVYVSSRRRLEHAVQIRLRFGAVVSVFDNGTVLVQGKLSRDTPCDLLDRLRNALPVDTRWCISRHR